MWSEEYVEKLNVSLYKLHIAHEFVYKFDINGNLVNTYESVELAAQDANSSRRLIFNAIAGKSKSKGYYYSYDQTFKPQHNTYNKVRDVYLYNLDGTFYMHFPSPRQCTDHFNDQKTSRLYAAIRTGGLYHQYQVSKTKVPHMKRLECFNMPRPILQYDLDGNLIKE